MRRLGKDSSSRIYTRGVSEKRHPNDGSNASLLAFLTKRFDKLDSDVERLDAQVSTIRDRMATKGDVEDVRPELEELSHRVRQLEKPAPKSKGGN